LSDQPTLSTEAIEPSPPFDHAKFISLVQRFYAQADLTDDELAELTRLHKFNMARVGLITTEGAARE
jgi:hypothetical protein